MTGDGEDEDDEDDDDDGIKACGRIAVEFTDVDFWRFVLSYTCDEILKITARLRFFATARFLMIGHELK